MKPQAKAVLCYEPQPEPGHPEQPAVFLSTPLRTGLGPYRALAWLHRRSSERAGSLACPGPSSVLDRLYILGTEIAPTTKPHTHAGSSAAGSEQNAATQVFTACHAGAQKPT